MEFLWLSKIRTQHSVCEDVCLIPGLAQWVKDPAWPWAVASVAGVARIWCCCGCLVDLQLQLQFRPLTRHYLHAAGMALKKEKKVSKKIKNPTNIPSTTFPPWESRVSLCAPTFSMLIFLSLHWLHRVLFPVGVSTVRNPPSVTCMNPSFCNCDEAIMFTLVSERWVLFTSPAFGAGHFSSSLWHLGQALALTVWEKSSWCFGKICKKKNEWMNGIEVETSVMSELGWLHSVV